MMSGNLIGGRKARDTNLTKDPDFYKKIGHLGGKNGHTGGFYNNHELAVSAGRKGGSISRRGKSIKTEVEKAEDMFDLRFIEEIIPRKHFWKRGKNARV